MTKRKKTTELRGDRAGSWLALLAATTLGSTVDTVRAEVQADGLSETATYRLVVQSYDAPERGVPGLRAKPVGSTQRAVTAQDLRSGVRVSLLDLRGAGASHLVAWVEAGQPDLEFDGRKARPGRGSVYGVVRRDDREETVRISLNRKIAA